MSNIVKTKVLTRRQREILGLIGQGKTSKQIAIELKISYRTVQDHRLAIGEKMGVSNAAAMVHKILSARIAELEAAHGAK